MSIRMQSKQMNRYLIEGLFSSSSIVGVKDDFERESLACHKIFDAAWKLLPPRDMKGFLIFTKLTCCQSVEVKI